MSNISSVHNIIDYVSGVTKALSGQRLESVSFKTDKETGIKPASKAISIPYILDSEIEANLSSLYPAIQSMLQTAQKDILRDAVLEGKTELSSDSLGVPKLVEYLNSVATGNRLTAQLLGDWFENEASEVLTVAIAEKLGITDADKASEKQVKTLADTLETYKKKFTALSSGRTKYEKPVIDALNKALDKLDSSDKIVGRLKEILVNMSNKPVEDMLAL